MSMACAFASGQVNTVLFSDDFTQDAALNRDLWGVNAPVVAAIADGPLVTPRTAFSSRGMTVAGVMDVHQFSGIKSKQAFKPPSTVQAIVTGVIAHANPFVLYLVTAGGKDYLRITGNSIPRNGPACKIGVSFKGEPVQALVSKPTVNKCYRLLVTVGGAGNVTVRVKENDDGTTVGEMQLPGFGTEPAFIVMAQSEPNPRTVGENEENEAIWRNIKVVSGRTPDNPASAIVSAGLRSWRHPRPAVVRNSCHSTAGKVGRTPAASVPPPAARHTFRELAL